MAAAKLTGERIEELKAKATTHFWPHLRQAGDMSVNLWQMSCEASPDGSA